MALSADVEIYYSILLVVVSGVGSTSFTYDRQIRSYFTAGYNVYVLSTITGWTSKQKARNYLFYNAMWISTLSIFHELREHIILSYLSNIKIVALKILRNIFADKSRVRKHHALIVEIRTSARTS